MTALANLSLLDDCLVRQHTFSRHIPGAGIVGYMRYAGTEGVEAFDSRMANAGFALPPTSVFRSKLVALPDDHFRIGFGHATFGTGLAALAAATHA